MDQELKTLQKFYSLGVDFLTNYSFQLIGAVMIVMIGWMASKYVYALLLRLFARHRLDVTLAKFIAGLAKILVLAAMVVVALGKIGISIAPFVAALGAVSLTAGLALQGSVANYAAGILLIISRPFKVGDTLSVAGVYGVVEEIMLACTLLRNEDEELISVPNKKMIGDILVNSFEYRVVESQVGISYESDPQKAITVITEVLKSFKEVSQKQMPIVGIAAFGESSIDLGLRYWVPTQQFFKLQYEINLALFEAFKHQNISIPYPQREIRWVGKESV